MAEQLLGRPLASNERVEFIDRDRTNLEHDNLQVVVKGAGSIQRTRAQILARQAELAAKLERLDNA